jgi:hypothetical protein
MATVDQMLKELRSTAGSLRKLWGAEANHWTINPDLGTVRHLATGDLIIYIDQELFRLELEKEF